MSSLNNLLVNVPHPPWSKCETHTQLALNHKLNHKHFLFSSSRLSTSAEDLLMCISAKPFICAKLGRQEKKGPTDVSNFPNQFLIMYTDLPRYYSGDNYEKNVGHRIFHP